MMRLNQISKQFVKHGLFVYVRGIRVINGCGAEGVTVSAARTTCRIVLNYIDIPINEETT